MFNVVLVHPEIPPNTGNVIRLAANTGCALHLVEPLGFLDGRQAAAARRARLSRVRERQAARIVDELIRSEAPDVSRMFAFTTRGAQPFATVEWKMATGWCSGARPPACPRRYAIHFRCNAE